MKTQTRKQRKKHTCWPWIVMILIMILVIAAAVHSMMRQASNADSSAAQSSSVSQAHPAPAQESEPTATPVPTATPEPELATDRPITTEEAAEMDALLDSMPGSISVWIQDIGSGLTYTYKPDNGFYCASTLKAPYARGFASGMKKGCSIWMLQWAAEADGIGSIP